MINRDEKKSAGLYAKMADFKNFAIILLCVGAFFYLGTIIPQAGKTEFSTYGYLSASLLFLTMSIGFFLQSARYKKILAELEE
ncbi:YrhC family protein [Bacillus massiliglaciei]|uniref:YrhC family protein n=1 Tax=Bacillus massiliglaciei TaxID=1816693 RepID=UPI000DA602CF|nr:YrhC family protein [Bacillus massiliglaciei]